MVEFANMAFSIKKGHVELDFSKIELYSNFLNTNLFGACFPTFFFFFFLFTWMQVFHLPPKDSNPKTFLFYFSFSLSLFFFNPLIVSSLSSYFSFSFSFLHMKPFPVSFFLFFSFSLFFTFLHAQPHRSLPLSLSLCPKMGYAGGYCSGSFMGCCYGFFFWVELYGLQWLNFMGCGGCG